MTAPVDACLLCPPPVGDRPPRRADEGYRTCSSCYDRLRDVLKDIARRYLLLNPKPGASGDHGGRGAPGYGSRSPASDHVIAMRDPRSSDTARAWVARDGRVHLEAERPPLSVHNVLATIARTITAARDLAGPQGNAVAELAAYIDGQLDWLTRQALVVDVARDLRSLAAQLRPVTGDAGRRQVGLCPNTIDEGDATRQCHAPLYAPLDRDTITCTSCRRQWHRPEWELLGQLLRTGTLLQAS